MLSESYVLKMARDYFDVRPGSPDDSDVSLSTEFAMKVLEEYERLKDVLARRHLCLTRGHSIVLNTGDLFGDVSGTFWTVRELTGVKCRNCDVELVLRYTEGGE